MQLRDDNDREQAVDQLWVLAAGAPRDAIRASVTAAMTRRISDALEEDKQLVAEGLLFELASLWQVDPGEVGKGLEGQAELLHKLRTTFAKSGASEPTIETLVLLAAVEPAKRDAHLAEIDEILAFADELASAENGPEAQRAQPIALLQPVVLALPVPWLVERYVTLLEQRQRVISDLINQRGASMQLVRAHHDILQTARHLANVLARAGRTDDIPKHLAELHGIGEDKELRVRADALVGAPTAEAYLELARALRSDDHDQTPDHTAALGVCLAGLKRFPSSAPLLAAAAEDAATLGRIEQPIALYEASLIAQGGQVDGPTALRLGKLYSQRIARLAFGGRPRAATTAWHELARYTDSEAHRAPHQVWAQVEAVAETALGRGLLSQGRLDEAEHALVASIDRAPSIDAYETLTLIDWKTNRLASASRYASAGLAILGETSGDHYRKAKLERIAGDVMRTAGKSRDAAALYLDSLRTWSSLGEDKNLPRNIAAERKLEFGRAMWFLGDSGRAVDLVLEATDIDPEGASTCSEAVAFLLEVGKPIDALDAVHRGLSASGLGELDKVYMCLWVLADARRRGEPHDRQAYEYLASRHGDLWYEQLAEAATNRLALAALRAAAITTPRNVELDFYSVVLGLDPSKATPAGTRKLLGDVVDAHLVMDAEDDLAHAMIPVEPREQVIAGAAAAIGTRLRDAGLHRRALSAWAGTDRISTLQPRLAELAARPITPASAVLALFVAGADVPVAALRGLDLPDELVERRGASLHARVTVDTCRLAQSLPRLRSAGDGDRRASPDWRGRRHPRRRPRVLARRLELSPRACVAARATRALDRSRLRLGIRGTRAARARRGDPRHRHQRAGDPLRAPRRRAVGAVTARARRR